MVKGLCLLMIAIWLNCLRTGLCNYEDPNQDSGLFCVMERGYIPDREMCRRPNEEFKECGSSCEEICGYATGKCRCGRRGICERGCFCKQGYSRGRSSDNYQCIPNSQCPSDTPSQTERCMEGWSLSPDSTCIKIFEMRKDWLSASSHCRSFGSDSDLVTIENEQLNNFLRGHIQDDSWIGLNDRDVDGRYEWSTSGPLRSYTNWDTPNLGHETADDCVYMLKSGKWINRYCNNQMPFICERKADINSGHRVDYSCGQNEEYNACGSNCRESCAYARGLIVCDRACQPGCFCKWHHARDVNERCIRMAQCPTNDNRCTRCSSRSR